MLISQTHALTAYLFHKMMTLFESVSLYREKATIWRVLSALPLCGSLAAGRIFRWFAVNIPMDLGTAGKFTSDIDILARLCEFPRSREWIYKTWEVKVSLLCKDGTARSLKAGKTGRTVKQLQAYRDFGSPDVSLLDVYICEAGFMSRNGFPPLCLEESLSAKRAELSKGHFGYQLLPFEHDKDGDVDVGLQAIAQQGNPLRTAFHALPSVLYGVREPFSRWAARIDAFFEQRCSAGPTKPFHQIVFCRNCRELQLIRMRDEHKCPNCGVDFILQS